MVELEARISLIGLYLGINVEIFWLKEPIFATMWNSAENGHIVKKLSRHDSNTIFIPDSESRKLNIETGNGMSY